MARIKVGVGAVTDKDGNTVDPTQRSVGGGGGAAFHLIPPDFYYAVVKGMSWDTYRAAWKGVASKAKDKKWTYGKITPMVELLNDNKTIINRQDFQVGVIDDKTQALIRPDGDTSKPNLWIGAQYLLGALGLLTRDAEDPNKFTLDFDPELVSNRIIKVKIGVGGYIKGERGFDVKEMAALLTEQNNGDPNYEFDDIPGLVDQYNDDNDYLDDDIKLKTKNVIVNVYGVDKNAIAEHEWFEDTSTGAVFLSEADKTRYEDLLAAGDTYEEPDF